LWALKSKLSDMRSKIIGFFMLFNCTFSFGQTQISNPKLKLLIDSLFIIDQKVQNDAIEAFQKSGSIDTFIVYERIEHQTFERHIPIIKKIYDENGYPTPEKVGKESSSNFFTLIQHSDRDLNFQIRMLPIIKTQVDQQQISGSEFAYLYDRIQINNNKEQLYGTQLDYDTQGNPIPKKLSDKKNVNKRRKKLKMSSIEEYLAKATEIHKQQNQKD
jgi:hypothetical protein